MTISRKDAPAVLAEQGQCAIRGAGNSMTPIIHTGDTIYLRRVDPSKLRKGDAVYCRVGHNSFVHLISAIDSKGERFQISNNRGHCNGWITAKGIYGLAVRVDDRTLVSDEELEGR